MNDLLLAPLVIMRRLPQLWFEALHPNPLISEESRRAVTEKLAALGEGMIAAQTEAFRSAIDLGFSLASGRWPETLHAPKRIAQAAMRPAARRVRVNARRLSRKK